MQAKKRILSEVDIDALLKSPKDIKLDIIKKIGKYYTAGSFSDEQKKAAEKIISTIAESEPDEQVRQAMSESIKNSNDIPHKIVMHLAEDVTVVSITVLEFSPVLTDENLIYIIQKTNDIEKEKSISKRVNVSNVVSNALIDKKHEAVIVTLLRNKSSRVPDKGYEDIIKIFAHKKSIMEEVMQRPKVPLYIVRDAAKKMSPENMNEVAEHSDDMEYSSFIKRAREKGINDDIIPIYALCKGSFKLFKLCVARNICIPVVNISKLLNNDENGEKFDIIYQRANLPDKLHSASRVLFLVLRGFSEDIDTEISSLTESEAKRVINNMIMLAEEMDVTENLEYLVSLINIGVNK
ncbi:MAG: hypothetical protein COV35_04365 [Alphaproteobacteria bacterium CG11_big_fil_rev_8_21_14_0_20_39_49]|nr:MAG: hypothetical protein COV35_04365 [Alphaproteobacteria bacterium CG11_big_fil_rev_8_21_14_0_20_39_49]